MSGPSRRLAAALTGRGSIDAHTDIRRVLSRADSNNTPQVKQAERVWLPGSAALGHPSGVCQPVRRGGVDGVVGLDELARVFGG